ncbi:hypothetical protein LEP1GSC161_4148 [Leptospira santarosai str. CBC1416]|uniref:Uncharacterized protein n=4 Tax=Leptospira santarosai TaxID=28183 RepID=M6VAJ3_9LEPT|nr:hypothetical protein LEP1GSC179_0810 [Leptospira santarosai str. MOR084]EKO76310.1 hypothetical protein LEP1GSC068_0300 [Leptospira sp. Fiocruz LV3954]EKR93601.1 hypothetical protein LEP1GSC163_1442 [Leptospira santarosai str. CBC379]EKS10090.1 hypothetical protein LEP1GSC071_3418 [Leptospira santarosai str. JET]EMF92457.1 hypothetical protein LEP1GSC005_3985 [Leptospira santarosai str. ST188]EMI60753.1 hypothetical protein LEP1GSC076_2659 [Leptospira sp. Fiocruz LV4135]EMJ46474.1 hypothet
MNHFIDCIRNHRPVFPSFQINAEKMIQNFSFYFSRPNSK